MTPKLYRSRTDSVIAGVCGGLGRYLGIDPVLVRLFFVLLMVGAGTGVLAYIILWIVVPVEPSPLEAGAPTVPAAMMQRPQPLNGEGNRTTVLLVGGGLIIFGVLILAQNLVGHLVPWLTFGQLWPLLLVAVGAAMLWRQVGGGKGVLK